MLNYPQLRRMKPKNQLNVSLDQMRSFNLNFELQHPSAHGILRLVRKLSDRTVQKTLPLLYKRTEKAVEHKATQQTLLPADYINYVSTMVYVSNVPVDMKKFHTGVLSHVVSELVVICKKIIEWKRFTSALAQFQHLRPFPAKRHENDKVKFPLLAGVLPFGGDPISLLIGVVVVGCVAGGLVLYKEYTWKTKTLPEQEKCFNDERRLGDEFNSEYEEFYERILTRDFEDTEELLKALKVAERIALRKDIFAKQEARCGKNLYQEDLYDAIIEATNTGNWAKGEVSAMIARIPKHLPHRPAPTPPEPVQLWYDPILNFYTELASNYPGLFNFFYYVALLLLLFCVLFALFIEHDSTSNDNWLFAFMKEQDPAIVFGHENLVTVVRRRVLLFILTCLFILYLFGPGIARPIITLASLALFVGAHWSPAPTRYFDKKKKKWIKAW